MGQLRSVEDQIGDIDALAVKYDDASLGTITLGGSGGTVLDNLAAGAVSASSLQAVNGAQMYAYLGRVAAFFGGGASVDAGGGLRSEEHTSELQPLMRISYDVFCLNKKYLQSSKR